jgi:hypothetical protein
LAFSSPERLNLGFLLREKLAAVLIIPCAWGSQLTGYNLHHHPLRQPSSLFWRRRWGRKRRLLPGEFFARTSFTLFYCFTYIILLKTQKKLVSFIVVYHV